MDRLVKSCAVVALVAVLGGCSSSSAPLATTRPTGSASSPAPGSAAPSSPRPSSAGPSAPRYVVPESSQRITVTDAVDHPWALGFLPDGSALLTQRAKPQILRLLPGTDQTPPQVGSIDGVAAAYEGGMLGLAVSPTVPADGLVFVYYSTATDERVARLHWDGARLSFERDILTGIPHSPMYHHGGRIAFGPDGMLYIGTGDAQQPSLAQDNASLAGKVLRIAPDGSVPADNPFGNPVWSYGHRNVEGLTWDDRGQLLESELGDKTYDELNVIEKGRNYGWPVVEGPGDGGRGMVSPVATWSPTSTCSPSGITYRTGTIYVACLAGERISTVSWDGSHAGTPQTLLSDLGRIRSVQTGPDGRLWVLTDNGGDDQVVVLPR